MSVTRRQDHSYSLFFRRTIAAQIHAVGLVLVLVAMALLLPKARVAGPDHFWASFVFLLTGAFVFFTSSAYHFLHDGFHISSRLELFLEDIDHYCIYLFIAGTYTPFLINVVPSPWREYLLVAIWAIAIAGIIYTRIKPYLFSFLRSRGIYTGLFVLMGLLLVVRAGDIFRGSTASQLFFLIAGSLAYMIGALGYATRRPVLLAGIFGYHELWHVMVLLGATLHFLFVYSFYVH